MILTNRLFERQPPTRAAKSLYIFCEGVKRECQYFEYFREKDSRINVEVYKLAPTDNNSPLGLLRIAQDCTLLSKQNPKPKYTFQKNDEVWIVLDTDPDRDNSRDQQINAVKAECEKRNSWFVVESNPCFEVWLYFHLYDTVESFDNDHKCKPWKSKIAECIPGGFDSRRHPILIEEAAINSAKNLKLNKSNRPVKGATQVQNIANSILSIIKDKIQAHKKDLARSGNL